MVLLVKLKALSDSLFGKIEVLLPSEVAFETHIFKFFLPGILSKRDIFDGELHVDHGIVRHERLQNLLLSHVIRDALKHDGSFVEVLSIRIFGHLHFQERVADPVLAKLGLNQVSLALAAKGYQDVSPAGGLLRGSQSRKETDLRDV